MCYRMLNRALEKLQLHLCTIDHPIGYECLSHSEKMSTMPYILRKQGPQHTWQGACLASATHMLREGSLQPSQEARVGHNARALPPSRYILRKFLRKTHLQRAPVGHDLHAYEAPCIEHHGGAGRKKTGR
jgi:hypothetical protein